MTYNREFKKFVRARMETTGETYMQAYAAVQKFLSGDGVAPPAPVVKEAPGCFATPPGPIHRPYNPETSLPHLVPLGVGEDSQEITWDILQHLHLVVSGRAGSGKSVVLNNIVSHLLEHPSDFEVITASPHARDENSPESRRFIDPLEALAKGDSAIEWAYQNFLARSDYGGDRWRGKRIVLIMDDAQNFLFRGNSVPDPEQERAWHIIQEILRKGRTLGMHAVISFQSLANTTRLVSNFSASYVTGDAQVLGSLVALGTESATRIPRNRGAGIVSFDGQEHPLQGYAPPKNCALETLPFI